MKLSDAWLFYDFILHNKLRSGLELGFFQGMSSAYLAGALQDVGDGKLTSIDLVTAQERQPNIIQVLDRAGLSDIVEVFFEPRSFNWRMMRFLQEGRSVSYDFCYLDGGHNWYDTGFGFCLAERLLAPGGWVVFDDLYFSYARSPQSGKAWVQRLPEDEQTETQVLNVFDLLVRRDPQFHNFRRLNRRFGFAQKKPAILRAEDSLPVELTIVIEELLERAQGDLALRRELLVRPGRHLAERLGDRPEIGVIRFIEGDSYGPSPVERGPRGEIVVQMERQRAT